MSSGSSYLDCSGRDDVLGGGARMIPVTTPAGPYRVWVKRVGNNPDLRVLLLHGGPGATHEYLEACDSYLPAAGVEYYYYDQLGSGFSDQPDEPSLWEADRFVDEVEQVGTRYDTMDPAHMQMMAERLPAGRYLYCPDGSHMAMYDDQKAYFAGLTDFLLDLGK